MIKTKAICISSLIFLLFGCYGIKGSLKRSFFAEGIYCRDNQKNFVLCLQDNFFSYFEKRNGGYSIYTCCDTITKGSYQVDNSNNLLYLSTSDYLNDCILRTKVQERKSRIDDSLFINLTNPIESLDLGDLKQQTNRLFYRVKLEGSDFSFLSQISGQIYESPKIKIFIPKDIKINNISFEIYPNYNSLQVRNFNVQYITTVKYYIKDIESKNFDVDIPGLDIRYLAYLRLHKDIIKIIDTNKLEWDGHYFIKQ